MREFTFESFVAGKANQLARAAAMQAMRDAGDHPLILSFGGATTTGVSPDNVRALARAARDYNERR